MEKLKFQGNFMRPKVESEAVKFEFMNPARRRNGKTFFKLIFITSLFLVLYFFSQANSFASSGGNSLNNRQTVKRFFVDPSDMRVSFDFQNASIVDVIRMIAKVSNMNVLIGSDVKGTVTMKMRNVPLKDILSVVMEAYGLGMVKKDGIYYINSSGTIASVVSAERNARAISEPKITKIIPINYVSANGLMPKIKTVLSSQGTIIYDKSLHALMITDTAKHVMRAVSLIKRLDKRTPEVEIVAKMVEVDSGYTSQLGINWEGGYSAAAHTTTINTPPNYLSGQLSGLPSGPGLIAPTAAAPTLAAASPGTFSIGIVNQYASVVATLQALESLNKVETLASPKVVVLNNQKATIEKGETLYLPGVAGVGAVAAPQAITAQISLNITPHIMANGNVKLTINSTNDTPTSYPGAQAALQTESVNSTVIVKSSSTVVLGGVYQTSKIVNTSGIPLLMNIPLLGWLFKSRDINYSKKELLIFITPRIIKS